jgi:hypothetical protein
MVERDLPDVQVEASGGKPLTRTFCGQSNGTTVNANSMMMTSPKLSQIHDLFDMLTPK